MLKTINGYITSISGTVPVEIIEKLRNRPTPPDGYIYRLRADTLEWELVELPPAPDPMEEDIPAEEALSQIQEVLGYEA